ncbi:MAG: DUF2461 domain-containing protein [Candidatus Binataceae bacterium]
MAKSYFTPRFFEFFEELGRNNNREWFQRNKDRYESDVRDPMLAFIADLGSRLHKLSRYYVADLRPNGGSMFRIYRNLRFSRDKTPYKTNAAAAIHHSGSGWPSPGFYISLSPEEIFGGVGMWHPDADALGKVRDAIVAKPAVWKKAIGSREFTSCFELMGEKLMRPPKGYDPDHPLIEDLKRKDFVVGANFTRKEACSSAFLDQFSKACAASGPFVKFLTEAMGLKW